MAPQSKGIGAVPSYELFRRYAKFTPEIGDFGMTPAEFRRFLADAGVGGLGGMLSGDTSLLFKKHSLKNHLTYDGACKAAMTVYTRIHSQHSMNCNKIIPSDGRALPIPPPLVGTLSAQAPELESSQDMNRAASLPGSVPAAEEPKDAALTVPIQAQAIGKAAAPNVAGVHVPEIVKAMNQRQELRKIRQQHFPEEKTEWASLQQRHNEYAAVRLMLEEPSLIREVIPPPKSTPSARVQTAVASVQSAISQGDFFLAKTALEEVRRTWTNELLSLSAAKAGKEGEGQVSAASQPKAPLAKRSSGRSLDPTWLISREGLSFMELMSVSVAISRGSLDQAREGMGKAWSSILAIGDSQAHIYSLLGLMLDALVMYFTHDYQQAAEKFRECMDKVDTSHGKEWKSTALAACNNIGVCLQMDGDRGNALKAYDMTLIVQEALKRLRAMGCGEEDNRFLLIKKNKARLLRSSAMMKTHSPHTPVEADNDAKREKDRNTLVCFLQRVIPTRLQSVGIPEKKKKKKKPKKSKKGAEEKKPDKKKAPKQKKLGVLKLAPRYALQGIGPLAPKKGKGKKKK